MTAHEPPDPELATASETLESLFVDARSDLGTDAEMARVRARLPSVGTGGGTGGGTPSGWAPAAVGGGVMVVIVLAIGLLPASSVRTSSEGIAASAPIAPPSSPSSPALELPRPSSDRGGDRATAQWDIASPMEPVVEARESQPDPSEPTPQHTRTNRRDESPPTIAPVVSREPSELALVREARAVLSRSPGEALDITERAARRYPTGALTPEREVIAIDALSRLGRNAEARRRASAFRTRHPGSALLERLAVIESRL